MCLPIRATSEPSGQTELQSTPRTQTVQTCQPGRQHPDTRSIASRNSESDFYEPVPHGFPELSLSTLHAISFGEYGHFHPAFVRNAREGSEKRACEIVSRVSVLLFLIRYDISRQAFVLFAPARSSLMYLVVSSVDDCWS